MLLEGRLRALGEQGLGRRKAWCCYEVGLCMAILREVEAEGFWVGPSGPRPCRGLWGKSSLN